MYIPSPASKTPRFFQPCPGNDEYQLEPGMYGIKDVSGGSEAWYRPFKTSVGDANPDPILIATAADIAAIVAGYVAKATFDANTILKADSDDTPVALAVGASTIVGRAATGGITALTAAQVATIINSSIVHNSLSGLNTGDYWHVNPSPAAGVDGWSVAESDYFSGGTKSASVKPLGLVLKSSFTNPVTANDRGFTIDDSYFYPYSFDTNTIYKVSRSSGAVVGSVITSNNLDFSHGTIIRGIIRFPRVAGMIHIDTKTLSESVATIAPAVEAASGGICVLSSGVIYAASATTLYKITESGSGYTSASLTPAGLVNSITGLFCDSTHYYIVDGTGTSYVVRKYLISTDALVLSSSSLSGDYYGGGSMGTSFLYVSVGTGYVLSKSTMATVATTAINTGFSRNGTVVDGLFCGSTATLISQYALPSLTFSAPRTVDFTQSDSFVLSATGITGVYTASDLIRNGVLKTGALWRDRLGVSITSVETSLPGSPVDGALYLILGGTSPYEGAVTEYIAAIGWAIHTPESGSSVIYGDYKYIYQNDRWEKTFEWYLKTELIDGSSSNPTGILYMDSAGTPSVLPAISDGEALEIEILLTAKPISGSWLSPSTISGKWKFDGLLGYESGQTIINNGLTTPVTFADIITSAAQYDLPTVGINEGDVEITVGVTFANSVTFEFSAVARGRVSLIQGYIPS